MRATRRERLESAQAGGALLMSVTAMLVVSVLAAAFLQLASAIQRRVAADADSAQAFNIAEAGLAEAYTGLAVARSGNVGTEEAPAIFAGGLFWVTATELDGGLVELESTALYGSGRAKLGVVCEPVDVELSSMGIFSGTGMTVGAASTVDSYDSSLGDYASQVGTAANESAIVGSNGDVSLAAKATVKGDVSYGTSGAYSAAAESTLTGTSGARAQDAELPPIDVPEVLSSPGLEMSEAGVGIVPAGEYGYEELAVAYGQELRLEGPLTLVVGDLSVARGGSLTFDTSAGPVRLHVTAGLDLAAGSAVTTSSTATADTIVMVSAPEGATVTFGSTSDFYGFVYVPETEARIGAAYEIFGGVVGHRIVLGEGANVHMDLALSSSLDSMLPLLHGWRVIEVPRALATSGIDPFRLLGVERAALLPPARAHADQVLEVKYVDLSGNEQYYLGPESGFDWSQVREVLYGSRDGELFVVPRASDPAPRPVDPGLDLVAAASSSSQLRDDLVALGDATSDALVAALQSGKLSSSDARDVLDAYSPLDLTVLLAAIETGVLGSSTLTDILVANSPLPVAALDAVLARSPALGLPDLLRLLSLQ